MYVILADLAPTQGDEQPLHGCYLPLLERCQQRRVRACGRSCRPWAGVRAACRSARIHQATTRHWPHSPPA
ncbi:hypothetical protein BRN91_16710 [Xanthomonas oryzae pv. oryzae]|nr:hypothetical protein BRN91_16710 [Xanthomonas oryzae pv. oryzae]